MNVVFVCSMSIIPEQVFHDVRRSIIIVCSPLDVAWENSQHDSFPTTKQMSWRDDYISRYVFLVASLRFRCTVLHSTSTPFYSVLRLPSKPWGHRAVVGAQSEGDGQHRGFQVSPAFVLKGPLLNIIKHYYVL
jgi:hypothetical protein